jgi:hypothetical protein
MHREDAFGQECGLYATINVKSEKRKAEESG